MKNIFLILLGLLFFFKSHSQNKGDDILGKWMSSANDLKVEVYKENGQYRAKVVWFACKNGHTMSDFYDTKNPNVSLRTRPWLGLQVLDHLDYNGGIEWNNGSVYEPKSGRTFSATCYLHSYNTLTVRGFWMYEWFGKNLMFRRESD
jgi:uncharacterized protein (DUF2147 family)